MSAPVIAGGPPVVIVRDLFDRSTDNGWGTADTGGGYASDDRAADLAVSDGAGRILLSNPASDVSVYLPETSARDVRLVLSVTLDQMPVGGGAFVYGLLRRTDNGIVYRPKIQIMPDGSVSAHVGVLTPTREHSLGRHVLVPDVTVEPNLKLWLSMAAIGGDPTFLGIRVWADGRPEPTSWHFSAIDWTGALQGKGAVGVAGYLGQRTTNGGLEIAFGDLAASTTDLQSE
jgi:hypothetical protein